MTKRKTESSEEDQMKRLVICKLCHETLEDPIILPCFKTICSKHLLNETNNFKYNLCDNTHDKTLDKFPANETVCGLLQIYDNYVDLNSIDLGPEYHLAKENLKNLNDLINESELLIRDPSFYINDYFTKLRNEIDLSKEKIIEDIMQKYEELINEVKEIETKCKQNAQNKESDKKLDQKIESFKENLNEWTEALESNLNRGECCENISNKSSQSISELKYEMNKCQVALLDNKEYIFNSILEEELCFDDLETYDAETIDESRLEGTLRFEIKDFSEFRYTFNKIHLIDQWFVVKNIPWSIGVKMNVIKNDIYLEILYRPLRVTKQLSESNPINTIIIQKMKKMIKTNRKSYSFGKSSFSVKFKNMKEYPRTTKFISLKDIMNPSNSLFNEKTDSVTIEVQIKIID